MLIRVGEGRSARGDLALAGLMSLNAGALNAAGFLMAGSFTANMTGNISAFAESLALRQVSMAFAFGGLVVAFITGAALAALIIQWGERRAVRTIYAQATLLEALLLAALGGVLLATPDLPHDLPVLVALSFLMGLQNAVTTMISGAKVRTTHVSGMATDVGIELAALTGPQAQRQAALPKLHLHSLTLLAFTLGGIGGSLIYLALGYWLFLMAAALLVSLALVEIARAKGPRSRNRGPQTPS